MRRFVLLLIAGMLLAAVPVTSVAGEAEEYEEVVFRVTLDGPVDPTHTFAVQRECPEEICATEDIVLVCSRRMTRTACRRALPRPTSSPRRFARD